MPDPKVIDMFMTIGCADAGGNFHVVKTEPVETKRLDDIKPEVKADLSRSMRRATSSRSCGTAPRRYPRRW